jgi:hypothetical protein
MQHLDVNIRRKNNEVLLTVVRARPGRDAVSRADVSDASSATD